MSLAQAFLAEFEQENPITRKFLERLPQDQFSWRPHPKSHTSGALALHIARVPSLIVPFVLSDQTPLPDVSKLFPQPATMREILDAHEESTAKVRSILPTLDDARLATDWSATVDGKPVATMPKSMVLRRVFLNHWIQHRGQFGVHLRLLGAKVPSSYGPSGDEG